MKCFLKLVPEKGWHHVLLVLPLLGLSPAAILLLTPAPRGSFMMKIMIKRNEREHSRTSGLENSLG